MCSYHFISLSFGKLESLNEVMMEITRDQMIFLCIPYSFDCL